MANYSCTDSRKVVTTANQNLQTATEYVAELGAKHERLHAAQLQNMLSMTKDEMEVPSIETESGQEVLECARDLKKARNGLTESLEAFHKAHDDHATICKADAKLARSDIIDNVLANMKADKAEKDEAQRITKDNEEAQRIATAKKEADAAVLTEKKTQRIRRRSDMRGNAKARGAAAQPMDDTTQPVSPRVEQEMRDDYKRSVISDEAKKLARLRACEEIAALDDPEATLPISPTGIYPPYQWGQD
jgi:hypothetical protein